MSTCLRLVNHWRAKGQDSGSFVLNSAWVEFPVWRPPFGHKYIGLIPGDPQGEWKSVFDGLVNAPADAIENIGIEILLRGEKRNSVTAGSPVAYRGVENWPAYCQLNFRQMASKSTRDLEFLTNSRSS